MKQGSILEEFKLLTSSIFLNFLVLVQPFQPHFQEFIDPFTYSGAFLWDVTSMFVHVSLTRIKEKFIYTQSNQAVSEQFKKFQHVPLTMHCLGTVCDKKSHLSQFFYQKI